MFIEAQSFYMTVVYKITVAISIDEFFLKRHFLRSKPEMLEIEQLMFLVLSFNLFLCKQILQVSRMRIFLFVGFVFSA